MHKDLLIPPSSVPAACLVVCGVPPCDCWVRFPDLRTNIIVQGGPDDLIPMNVFVQGGLVI